MKPLPASMLAVLLLTGCEPTEQTHARILGGNLRYLYREWSAASRPDNFEPTNYITANKATFFKFDNTIADDGVTYHCRFGVRSPGAFARPGVLAISEEGALLWVGDDGMTVVAPDTKRWSSKATPETKR